MWSSSSRKRKLIILTARASLLATTPPPPIDCLLGGGVDVWLVGHNNTALYTPSLSNQIAFRSFYYITNVQSAVCITV